jgi:sugar phosphate isomerase/epimerase
MIGAPTSPQTADQIREATSRLNAGVYGVEVGSVSPEVFESIPKQHFEELRRLAKLSDAKMSVHGPGIDLTGFAREGWSEQQRQQSEYQVVDVLDKAHALDPEGTNVTLHSSGGIPGTTWRKISEREFNQLPKEEQEEVKKANNQIPESMMVINQETGQYHPAPLKYEVKEYPGGEKEVWTPERRLQSLNQTQWAQDKLQLLNLQKQKEEVEYMRDRLIGRYQELKYGEQHDVLSPTEKDELRSTERNISLYNDHVKEVNEILHSQLTDLYNRTKFIEGSEDKERFSKESVELKEKYTGHNKEIHGALTRYQRSRTDEERARALEQLNRARDQQIRDLQHGLEKLPTPELFKSTDKFANEKTAETVANAALQTYYKFGNKAPSLVLENVYPEWTLSRAESLKEVIEKSRELFADKLIKSGIKKDKARDEAAKLIGATWDLGHINMLRKYGYSEKEILEETKRIAPFVKHVHMTDNFGFSDAHLPSGMGNVPTKEHLRLLEKEGFKFEKGKGVMEAGGFVQHFKESPHLYALEALSSPLYTYDMVARAPYWEEIRETPVPYMMGYGDLLPEVHFKELYGAGFMATLPKELGGQVGGARDRFAGTPTA